jgi:hypothetical protein
MIRKVRLDVSVLQVQSFETEEGAAKHRGTVHAHTGHRCPTGSACISDGAAECNTVWDRTCGEAEPSCDPSCDPYVLCCATDGAFSCAP